MTNEDIIRHLEGLRHDYEPGDNTYLALGLAIDALREPAKNYRSTKYTPGPAPWTHTPDGIRDADGAFVVRNYEVSYNDERSTRDDWKRWADRRSGNYRLILAAPEMLEALIATRESVYFHTMNRKAREAVEAAIAKAEGHDT